jgi:protocatechuate 3,4-dioxygenase beta subunit
MATDQIRRGLLLGLGAGLIGGPAAAARLLEPTPRQAAGPFYPVELPLDDDNDLIRVEGQPTEAEGRSTNLSGRILDRNGRPLAGMRIEIWQCDANGRYRHPRDRGPAPDPGFQGHGATVSDAEGRYRFRTIHPVPYPGRTPHIHVAVFPSGERPFTTQLYVEGETRNDSDFLFHYIPEEARSRVLARFEPEPRGDAELRARFDLVLGITPQG